MTREPSIRRTINVSRPAPARSGDAGTVRRGAVLGLLVRVLIGVACALVAPGCTSDGQPNSQGQLLGGAQQPGGALANGAEIQSAVMSFADRFVAGTADASDRAAAATGSPEAKVWIERDKALTALSAFTIAAGASPIAALLDITVLVTLKRMLLEEYWAGQFPAGALEPLIRASQQAEDDIWKVAGRFISEQQQKDLRELIARWRKDNPDQRYIANIRFSSFDSYRNRAAEISQPGRPGSIFSLLYLDPFPNLDPTVREIAQIRALVERESYFLERLPLVLSYQAALFVEETATMPQVRSALADAARFSEATDRFATASQSLVKDLGDESHVLLDQLATKVTAERRAALDQAAGIIKSEREALTADLSKTLDKQRAGLFDDIDARNQQAREMLADLRATSDRMEALSISVHGTVDAIEKLSTPTPPKPGEPPSHPFDPREYQTAADSIALAARDTTALMQSIGSTFNAPVHGPVDATLYGAAAARFDESIQRAVREIFWRGLVLVVVAVAGAGAIVLLARRRKTGAAAA